MIFYALGIFLCHFRWQPRCLALRFVCKLTPFLTYISTVEQCEQVEVLFLKVSASNFLTKVAQLLGDLLGRFEKSTFTKTLL